MSMQDGVLYLTEQDVVSIVDMPKAINALENMLSANGKGLANNVPKALGTWGEGSSMHSLGSYLTGAGYCGFKNWVRTNNGGGSIYSLFNSENGKLLALIEARALGMLRTAAITGVATKIMAPKGIKKACLIGTGSQAVTQLSAIAAVTDLEEVLVYSPSSASRDSFVAKLSSRYKFKLEAANSLEHAVDSMQLITTVTRAVEPFLTTDHVSDNCHINAVGAILPKKAELSQSLMQQADFIVTDDKNNAAKGSRELIELLGNDTSNWGAIKTLGEVVASEFRRPANTKLSIFKSMGMGISDLAIAIKVYESSAQSGAGTSLASQTRENLLLR